MRVYTPMRAAAKSFEACRTCACSSLRRASRAVTQHYERHFRGSGLRATQFTILATLAQTGPLSISELSAQLGLDRTTLSRNLRLIEDEGWIAPLGHDDQRVRKMTLTHKGIKGVGCFGVLEASRQERCADPAAVRSTVTSNGAKQIIFLQEKVYIHA